MVDVMNDALDSVIDEIASSGISETVSSLSKMNVVDGDNSEWNETLSANQQSESSVMKTRKRSAAKDVPSTSGQANRPKRGRKQTGVKLLEKNDTKKEKGKFSRTRDDKSC